MAMRDITELMNAYRECSRNLWNVYFSGRGDIGGSLDAFGQIRQLLFNVLIISELSSEAEAGGEDMAPPVLKVMPKERALILIQRLSEAGQARYWDQEKDMVVGPRDITMAFLDYFDFSDVPIQDFHYYRCKVLSFPSHPDYEGREALLEVSDAKVSHDERGDQR
jgi:hypothetical protein